MTSDIFILLIPVFSKYQLGKYLNIHSSGILFQKLILCKTKPISLCIQTWSSLPNLEVNLAFLHFKEPYKFLISNKLHITLCFHMKTALQNYKITKYHFAEILAKFKINYYKMKPTTHMLSGNDHYALGSTSN